MTRILAKAASFTDDGECTMLGFADDPTNPVNYVLLQLSNEPDEEELSYGWGGIHINTGALHVDGYDLIQDIRETDAGIVLSLISDAARKAGVDQDIEIELQSKEISGIPVSEAVRRFRDRLMAERR